MSTTKSVSVTLKSVIDNLSDTGLPTDDRETSESVASGTLTASANGAVITFTECGEGGKTRTKIEILGKRVRVLRHGAIESNMLFAEGISHASVYGAPPYTFDVNIFTRKIRGEVVEEGGKLDIFYDMEIGGAKKSVKLQIICEADDGN